MEVRAIRLRNVWFMGAALRFQAEITVSVVEVSLGAAVTAAGRGLLRRVKDENKKVEKGNQL